MSDVPKRNVERRKAAENSEKKWKEAFEEDEDIDPLQEVLLRSLELAEAHVNNQVFSDTLLDNTNCNEFEEQDNYEAGICNCNKHTLLEDNLLKEIVMSMACPSCHSNEPVLNYSKDKCGRLGSICINCCKCKQIIFTRTISDLDLKNIKCTCDLKNRNTDYGDKTTQNESNTNVELLVCDVDVIKQTEGENQYSKCYDENERSNLQNNNINVISQIKKPHNKPIRPCFFCSKMQVRLSRHIKTTHMNHPYVQNMFKQPMEIQAKMMRQLRAEGIFAENQRRIKAGRFDLLRIRNQGSGELSACIYCRGYYKKKLLSRHKSTCIARPNSKESSLKYSLIDSKEESLEKLCATDGNQAEQCLEGSLDTNFDWNDIVQTENCVADSSDPPEISRIRDILDGLGHGIFSPTNQPLSVNGFFIKQEKEDFIEDIIIPTNNDSSDHSGHHQFREGESNEDQMLFDSLPAILSNSNVSIDVGNNGCQIPVLQPKVKRMENFNEGYGDENHYYVWQDITENDLQNHELLPCDALYQPQRKRKPRSEFQYQFWKKEDEKEILNYFTDMIKALKVPGKDACREFLSKNPHIKTDWTRVKYKVYNQIQKHKKKSKIGSDYGV